MHYTYGLFMNASHRDVLVAHNQSIPISCS
jgi:hypothetical protein